MAREQEKKKKNKESAKPAAGVARREEPLFEAFVAPTFDSSSEVERASKLQVREDCIKYQTNEWVLSHIMFFILLYKDVPQSI